MKERKEGRKERREGESDVRYVKMAPSIVELCNGRVLQTDKQWLIYFGGRKSSTKEKRSTHILSHGGFFCSFVFLF